MGAGWLLLLAVAAAALALLAAWLPAWAPASDQQQGRAIREGVEYEGAHTHRTVEPPPPRWRPPLPNETIDVVYLWVNGSDPAWRARRAEALGRQPQTQADGNAHTDQRFADGDELRHSLRALLHHGEGLGLGTIHIVVGGGQPTWLGALEVAGRPRVHVVREEDLLVGGRDEGEAPGTWPTFNSNALFAKLHRVGGLAEHFVVWDDDVFLDGPVDRAWWLRPGRPRVFCQKFHNACLDAHSCSNHNANALLLAEFGGRVEEYQALYHAPLWVHRPLLGWLASRYAREWARTAANQFRASSDTNVKQVYAWYAIRLAADTMPPHCEIVGSRAAHYVDPAPVAGAEGAYVVAESVDVSGANVGQLQGLTTRHTFLNLNNNDRAGGGPLQHFLAQRYPWPSPYEHTD